MTPVDNGCGDRSVFPRLPPGGSSRRSRVKEHAVPECHHVLRTKACIFCFSRSSSATFLHRKMYQANSFRHGKPCHLPQGWRLEERNVFPRLSPVRTEQFHNFSASHDMSLWPSHEKRGAPKGAPGGTRTYLLSSVGFCLAAFFPALRALRFLMRTTTPTVTPPRMTR